MAKELRAAVRRSSGTLLVDALGVLALIVLLIGGLYLPAVF